MPPCSVGMEACVGAYHLSRRLKTLRHDARLMPAKYCAVVQLGTAESFPRRETIAEAVQRPTMKFIATKTAEQFDQQELHRVRERLVSQLIGIINQIVEIERLGSLEIDHRLVFRRLFKQKGRNLTN